jgi:hypothetical protein
MVLLGLLACSEKSKIVTPDTTDAVFLYETIEHAAIHMVDGPAKIVIADSVKPGPHLDPDSIEHRRLDVVLLPTDTLQGGYIHFGPNAVGDFLVMTDAPARIRFVNRTVSGSAVVDSLLEIEERFSAQQISDSTGTTIIKQALLFEARSGGNILCIDSMAVDTLRIVIEEAEHDHAE